MSPGGEDEFKRTSRLKVRGGFTTKSLEVDLIVLLAT